MWPQRYIPPINRPYCYNAMLQPAAISNQHLAGYYAAPETYNRKYLFNNPYPLSYHPLPPQFNNFNQIRNVRNSYMPIPVEKVRPFESNSIPKSLFSGQPPPPPPPEQQISNLHKLSPTLNDPGIKNDDAMDLVDEEETYEANHLSNDQNVYRGQSPSYKINNHVNVMNVSGFSNIRQRDQMANSHHFNYSWLAQNTEQGPIFNLDCGTSSRQIDDVSNFKLSNPSTEIEPAGSEIGSPCQQFDIMFDNWKVKFDRWKSNNINNPDKEYVRKQEQQMIEMKNSMIQRRFELERQQGRTKRLLSTDEQHFDEGKKFRRCVDDENANDFCDMLSRSTSKNIGEFQPTKTLKNAMMNLSHNLVKSDLGSGETRSTALNEKNFEMSTSLSRQLQLAMEEGEKTPQGYKRLEDELREQPSLVGRCYGNGNTDYLWKPNRQIFDYAQPRPVGTKSSFPNKESINAKNENNLAYNSSNQSRNVRQTSSLSVDTSFTTVHRSGDPFINASSDGVKRTCSYIGFDDRHDIERQRLTANRQTNPIKPRDKPREVRQILSITDLLLQPPGRYTRPPKIVIILRGLPGSGKSYIAKQIKLQETMLGSEAPRILALDDYFQSEGEFIFETEMLENYRLSLIRSFKKQIDDGYFSFIMVDAIHNKTRHYEPMWSYAKQKGFEVYIAEVKCSTSVCDARKIHNRGEKENSVKALHRNWDVTPPHFLCVDVSSLDKNEKNTSQNVDDKYVQSHSNKEEEKLTTEENVEVDDSSTEKTFPSPFIQCKWELLDDEAKLARLDGTSNKTKMKLNNRQELKSIEDWLDMPNQIVHNESSKKSVRWADLEERRTQAKLRDVGFVVGQTDWKRMMDPLQGEASLTSTKIIPNRYQSKSF